MTHTDPKPLNGYIFNLKIGHVRVHGDLSKAHFHFIKCELIVSFSEWNALGSALPWLLVAGFAGWTAGRLPEREMAYPYCNCAEGFHYSR